MTTKPFDQEAAYDEKIAPLMTQIIAICREHEIPMVASFHLTDEDLEDEDRADMHCTTALPFPHQSSRIKELNKLATRTSRSASPLMITTENGDGSKTITAVLG